MSSSPVAAARPPFDPKADRYGRRWIAQPGAPLWTLQIRDELALDGVQELGNSRPITMQVDSRTVTGQLIARRRVEGTWWGLCLLDTEWEPGSWQGQLSWHPADSLTLPDLLPAPGLAVSEGPS